MKILDGKKTANRILVKLKKRLDKTNVKPTLAVILVGNDEASHIYVKIKERTCKQVGIGFEKFVFDDSAKQNDIIGLVKKLNADKKINGIIVQLPLPSHLNTDLIISTIDVKKDVDGLHPENLGKLLIGESTIIPPTPAAVLEILKSSSPKAGAI